MTDAEIALRFKDTIAVIEATSEERFALWQHHAKVGSTWFFEDEVKPRAGRGPWPRVEWDQYAFPGGNGYWLQIGELAGQPVCIGLSWVRLNGKLVVFWNQTSQVTDRRLVEKYLRPMIQPDTVETNATNFAHVIHKVMP